MRVYLDSSLKVISTEQLRAAVETLFQQLEDQINKSPDVISLTGIGTLPEGIRSGDVVFKLVDGLLKIGVYNGSQVIYGISSNIPPVVICSWQYYTLTVAPIANNHLHFNHATLANVTALYLTRLASGNDDWSLLLDLLIPGNRVTVQDANDSLRWAKWVCNGPVSSTVSGIGSYYTIPVTLLSESGLAILNNQQVSVGFIFSV